jgi:hypothetical protein
VEGYESLSEGSRRISSTFLTDLTIGKAIRTTAADHFNSFRFRPALLLGLNSMPPNPFDQACRYLLRRCPALLRWLLEATADVVFVRWLPTKLTIPDFPERENDMIAHVRRQDQGGMPWAIPVEFQVEPDPLMFGRLLIYEGLIWVLVKPTEHPGDRFNLLGLVVNLTGIGTTGQNMEWTPGKGTGLLPIERNLQGFSASTVLEQIANGKVPRAALALLPLMIGGGEPGIIKRWLEVAAPETDEQWRRDFCLALVFAELTGCQEDWTTPWEGSTCVNPFSSMSGSPRASAKARSRPRSRESRAC